VRIAAAIWAAIWAAIAPTTRSLVDDKAHGRARCDHRDAWNGLLELHFQNVFHVHSCWREMIEVSIGGQQNTANDECRCRDPQIVGSDG
jgi:hypothetical protein